jgi:hypothetical protein
MRITIIAASVLVLLSACRGERPPRDYQNAPPAMTHPPTSSAQTPTVNGMRGAAPEPSKGAEGRNVTRQPTSPIPPTETLGNQAPVTRTHT